MKTRARLTLTFLFITCTCAYGQQSPVDVANSWLLTNCSLGSESALEAQLRALASSLESYFITAITDGPSGSIITQQQSDAQEQYIQINMLIKSGETFGLSSRYLSILSGQSEDDFVSNYVKDFALTYQKRGVVGLAFVASPNGKRVLQGLAADRTSPLQDIAKEAIKRYPVPGDLNEDGKVDCRDLSIVKASFGKKTGQPGFDPLADVNGDGVVNILDLSFVARQLPAGMVCR